MDVKHYMSVRESVVFCFKSLIVCPKKVKVADVLLQQGVLGDERNGIEMHPVKIVTIAGLIAAATATTAAG